MSDIKRLYEDLQSRLYKDKVTTLVHFNLSGATAFIPFPLHDMKFYDDNKSVEITGINDTVFTVDLTQIKDCIREEEEEDIEYTISFDTWSVDVRFIGGLES